MKRLNKELRRVNDELRLLSNTDGLLRIANRRYFDETLERELQRAIRRKENLCLLLIDVEFMAVSISGAVLSSKWSADG